LNETRTCPVCLKTLPADLQAQFCPYCGATLIETESSSAGTPTGESGGDRDSQVPQGRKGIPWEETSAYPDFVQRLTQTWSQSMLQTGEFFRQMRLETGAGPALLYALIMIIMGQAFNVFWQQFFAHRFTEYFEDFSPFVEHLMAVSGAQQLVLGPLLALLGLFVGTLIYHLSLVIVGGARHGMATTFRVLAYAESTQLLMVIPLLGQFIAMVWSIVIMIIGFKEAHETTMGRSVLAVLLPILFCCALILIMVMLVGGVLMNLNSGDAIQ